MVAEKDDTDDESFRIDAPVLVTERLVLRAPQEGDIAAIVELADNRRIAEMLARLPHPYTDKDAAAFIAMTHNGRGKGATYALTLASPGARPGIGPASGELIGVAGLDPREQGLELGYWIGEPHWNKGYATEVAHALVDLAFRTTPIKALHVACRVINPASRRVIHKCGFQYAGQGMLNSIVAGKVPVERYRLDRKTWTSLKGWRTV